MTTPDVSSGQDPADEQVLTERSPRVVAAHKLLRKARRMQAGEFLVEGAQAVTEAVAAGATRPGLVRELFVTEAAGRRSVELVRTAYAAGARVSQVTDRAAAALSDTTAPQGIVALCELAWTPLDEVLAAGPAVLAVLVGVSDPGNAGTVIRLADAVGADAVVFAGESVDPFNAKAVRASTGSLFHLPVVYAEDPIALLAELSAGGMSCLATTGAAAPAAGGRAALDLFEAADGSVLDLPTAWVFGSEAHGLPAGVLEAADAAVTVPIFGRAESLNLAAAAAVCLYAGARTRRATGLPGRTS